MNQLFLKKNKLYIIHMLILSMIKNYLVVFNCYVDKHVGFKKKKNLTSFKITETLNITKQKGLTLVK